MKHVSWKRTTRLWHQVWEEWGPDVCWVGGNHPSTMQESSKGTCKSWFCEKSPGICVKGSISHFDQTKQYTQTFSKPLKFSFHLWPARGCCELHSPSGTSWIAVLPKVAVKHPFFCSCRGVSLTAPRWATKNSQRTDWHPRSAIKQIY